MSPRRVARDEVRVGHRHDLGAEKRNEPSHRTREEHRLGAPSARFGPRDPLDKPAERFGQQVGNRTCRDALGCIYVFDAVDLAPFKLFDRHALSAGKTLRSLRGVALGVERDLNRRTLVLLDQGFGFLGNRFDDRDETPRRRLDAHGAMGNAKRIKRFRNKFFQLLRRVRKVECGNLLGSDFKSERPCVPGHVTPPSLLRRRLRASRPPHARDTMRKPLSQACARAGCRPCARLQISRPAHRAN